jgi:sodium-dependent dicarboxylate transporter 2/3/5
VETGPTEPGSTSPDGSPDGAKTAERNANIRNMIYLSVAYASNTGGTGTLTGTGTNLVFKGVIQEFEGQPINFATWMAYAVPQMLLCVFVCFVWLQFWFMGLPSIKDFSFKRKKENTNEVACQSISIF